MQYQVFVQGQAGQGFIAAVIGMHDCIAEGQTKEEAIARARAALEERLAQGEIVTIEVESGNKPTGNPWLDSAGVFRNDPTFDDFLAEIEKNRRETDAENAAE